MRAIFFVFLIFFSASALFCQTRMADIQKFNKKYMRQHGRPVPGRYISPRDHRSMTTDRYFKRQQDLDDRIKSMEFKIAELKKEKTDLKREYLSSLDEKIKMQDADIERLKKEKNEVLSAKSAINERKREKRKETLDGRLNEKKREIQELKKMKENVDSSKSE